MLAGLQNVFSLPASQAASVETFERRHNKQTVENQHHPTP